MLNQKYQIVLVCLLGAVLCSAGIASAQDGVPAFKNLRFEEDWSAYPEEGTDSLFDPLKRIELSENSWLSIGGEARARLETWNNFGFSDANDDSFLLYRTFLHGDFHFGEHWRGFLEVRFSGVTERDLPGGRREALDTDYGDIWNAFVEADYDWGKVNAVVRLGRQELQFGKQRLISPLDWANNRRIFEGGVLTLRGSEDSWKADFFVTAPVIVDRNEFNEHDDHHLFSGIYMTKNLGRIGIKGLDAYFLAFNSTNSAAVNQDRYTLGGRVWGEIIENLTYDLETAFQTGQQDGSDIQALMFTAEGTYTFSEATWTPWITLGAGIASGDDSPTDADIETFNQLFPLGHAYLGYIDAVARQNIADVRLSAGAWPVAKKVRLQGDAHFLWLADADDALYNAGGGVLRAGAGDSNFVGTELDFTVLWNINRHANLLGGYSHFFAGDAIEDTGPSDDIDFFYTQITFTF